MDSTKFMVSESTDGLVATIILGSLLLIFIVSVIFVMISMKKCGKTITVTEGILELMKRWNELPANNQPQTKE